RALTSGFSWVAAKQGADNGSITKPTRANASHAHTNFEIRIITSLRCYFHNLCSVEPLRRLCLHFYPVIDLGNPWRGPCDSLSLFLFGPGANRAAENRLAAIYFHGDALGI